MKPDLSGALLHLSSGPSRPSATSIEGKVLDKRRLGELVKEVDPLEQLDDDVEEVGSVCVLFKKDQHLPTYIFCYSNITYIF